ncbi:MAG: ATP-binding protein, partial [Alsobacter sp.]
MLGCEPSATLPALLATCSRSELEALLGDWGAFARPDQRPPAMGRDGLPWTVWLVLGGRGAGKTRTGAEWVRRMALGDAAAGLPPVARIAL